ncbi:hypothetical protein [Bradyrhizobium liaoningense]|uniref:hypothetical protein n=1 Tax=Bradyrhizobium liaoningense TaxID=43992 RepID=UPI0020138BE1|nr:hypothetical protein [Bradyrhizobium liaoningense]
MLDQRPRATQQRRPAVAPWQRADIWPLVLDVIEDIHGNCTGGGKILGETREKGVEGLQPTGQKKMRMPILGNAGAGHDRSRQDIAFENGDFLEGGRKRTGGRQSSNPRSDDNRALPKMTAHIYSFGSIHHLSVRRPHYGNVSNRGIFVSIATERPRCALQGETNGAVARVYCGPGE